MLHLYHSNRLERLAEQLADTLSVPLGNALTAETLVVQHQGMGRWLSLELAERLGICANTHFLLPAGFIWQLLRQLLDDVPDTDNYQPALMQWWLFDQLANLPPDKRFSPLNNYLQPSDELMRFQLAGEIANCFDQYLVYRPEWIQAWQGKSNAMPGDVWQALLWQALQSSRKEMHWVDLQQRLNDAVQTGSIHCDRLPERVCLFALSSLSPGYLEILNTAAQWVDIHLFVLNPAEGHWMDLVSEQERSRRELLSETEALYLDVGNPLLASLGRQGGDFFSSLIAYDSGSWDLFVSPERDSVLHRIQSDILQVQVGNESGLQVLNSDDRSIEFHICHSPMRELEVLHDQLLDRFSLDPTLKPTDVLVMMPDMDSYAPYIEAVFGETKGSTTIPYTLSDRSQVSESPVVSLFLQLLTQTGGRYPVDQVLTLLEQPLLHRRFGLEADDLPRIQHWVELVSIRWSKSGDDRAALGLPVTGQNSWQTGLDRLLLGYALSGDDEEGLFQGLLPCAEVEGTEAQLLGYLQSFLTALFELEAQLLSSASLPVWKDRIYHLIDRFFEPEGEEVNQVQAIRAAMVRIEDTAREAGFAGLVSRDLIISQLNQQLSIPASGRFLGGGVNFCALTPMRALPFKVICMIGMNDGAYPRDRPPVGFNLMAGNYRLGDRSRRADDRYLFLETLISAREQLYISYTGRDVRDNSVLPPSVLVSELSDSIDGAYQSSTGLAASVILTTQHPLQAFNPRYFEINSPLFSYSSANCRGADALKRTVQTPTYFISQPLAEATDEWRQVELNQLIGFYRNPARYLLSNRVGIRIAADQELLESRDPFELDYFEQDALFGRLVAGSLTGRDQDQLMAVERARGLLPHGVTGEIAFDELANTARQFSNVITSLDASDLIDPLSVDFRQGSLHLVGQLESVRTTGLFGYTYHKLPDTQLLALWLKHLVLNVTAPAGITPVTRWLSQQGLLTFNPVADSEVLLGELLDLYWQGLSEPLPLFPKSARAYVTALMDEKPRERCLALARDRWFGGYNGYAEYDNPYYRLAYPLGEVLDERFESVSERVFAPLLSAMEMS